MSGLDTAQDKIIEIATIVTDNQLNILAEGPVFAIHQACEILEGMDEWNTRQHGHSGLTERVRQSTVTEAHAEAETLAFLQEYVPPRKSPMAGNSICQDRRFLHRCMPRLESHFHYRNLDVSTIKILVQHWRPGLINGAQKKPEHLALQDIRDSINELRYYREHFFKLES